MPMSPDGILFWIATSTTCIDAPMPRPNRNMYALATVRLVSVPIVESNTRLTVVAAMPTMG